MNKLYLKFDHPQTMEQMMEVCKYYQELFDKYVNEWENLRHLEKGERYLSDDFIIISADYTRIFSEREDLSELQREECCLSILKILEKVSNLSPYNFDIKLRLMYFCDNLNYYDRLLSVFETMDIKAVQFETVGYWMIKSMINYDLWESQESTLVRMVRSYQ